MDNQFQKGIESLIEVILGKNINVILATARSLRNTLPLLPKKHDELPIIGCIVILFTFN
jgi:hydroxymethylpyrimidine pyrophosphatase-like HAD family hydrolase